MNEPALRVLRGASLPPRIRDLPRPPEELFLHGELPRGPCVAIVGTRRPSTDGEQYARHLAGVLGREGVVVISGGAAGIDAAAHRGALDVGAPTLVVAPAGFDQPFPAEHRELFQEVLASGGGYLSLVPPDVPADRARFFQRNRLLAALAHAVVMAQAPWRSGARNATKHARRLGRPVFVVAHPPWSARGGGWLVELGLGARPFGAPKELLRFLSRERLHLLPCRRGGDPVPAPSELAPGESLRVLPTGHPPEIAGRTAEEEASSG